MRERNNPKRIMKESSLVGDRKGTRNKKREGRKVRLEKNAKETKLKRVKLPKSDIKRLREKGAKVNKVSAIRPTIKAKRAKRTIRRLDGKS